MKYPTCEYLRRQQAEEQPVSEKDHDEAVKLLRILLRFAETEIGDSDEPWFVTQARELLARVDAKEQP